MALIMIKLHKQFLSEAKSKEKNKLQKQLIEIIL